MTVGVDPQAQNLSPTELTHRSLSDAVDFKAHTPVANPEVSGPQGSVRPFTMVNNPSAWKAADWKDNQDWVYRLSQADIAELDTAVSRAVSQGIRKEGNYLHIRDAIATKADFLLPTLGAKLEAIRENVRIGRGFQLIKDLPVERYTREETMVAYFGIGLHLGRANPQNKKAHLIGHIKDINGNPHDPITRIYTTSIAQPFHTDISDIVGLLCLKQAKRGGLSSFSSGISIVNEMLRLGRRDLVEELAGPQWWLDRKGEVPAGMQPFFRLPILHYYQGLLGVSYSATYYHLAQRHPEVPRLTARQEEALRYFNALARSDELRMDMDLEPGDIQLLYNHAMLHSRSAFDDHDNWEDRRHLLRLWVSPQTDRPLPEVYANLWGNIEPGNRGGLKGMGNVPTIPMEAE